MDIGQRLTKAREARGYTIRLLANRAGIAPGTLSRCENDHGSLNLSTATLIADELGISLDWLTGREGREYDNPI